MNFVQVPLKTMIEGDKNRILVTQLRKENEELKKENELLKKKLKN